MQGVLVSQWQPFDQLTLQELPLPEIADNELLLRVHAVSYTHLTLPTICSV